MIPFSTWCISLLGALAFQSTGAWIDEDFEHYPTHADLMSAWPCIKGFQDGRISKDQFLSPGCRSFFELPDEDTRHERVFDPANAVTGTDTEPLRFVYDLFITRHVDGTFRYCEVLNTETGDRIALGPRDRSTYWQVFDGMCWRDLVYAPERSVGWNGLDMTIKKDVLCIRVTNAKGSSYEEVPRATHSGFGTFGLGGGIKNRNSPTYVDNVRLEGGVTCRQVAGDGRGPVLSPACQALVRRTNDTLQGCYRSQCKPGEALTTLEGLLQEAEKERVAPDAEDVTDALPWVYEAIAVVKGLLRSSPKELERVHYEAISRTPNGIGADVAVRNLSASLSEPERTHFLLNVAAAYPDKLAGLEAARVLVGRPTQESASVGTGRLLPLMQRGAGTPIPEAVACGIVQQGNGDDNAERVRFMLSVLGDEPTGLDILHRHCEQLIKEEAWSRLEQFATWVIAQGLPACSEHARVFLFQARLRQRDTWGSLAAVAGLPLDDGRRTLLTRLAGMNRLSAIQSVLGAIVSKAMKAGIAIELSPRDVAVPDSPEALLWEAIAIAGDRAGLPHVTAAAYQYLAGSGKPISATDGSLLDADFAAGADPNQLARFWKAHYLALRERKWESERLFTGLVAGQGSALSAQAAFDLARVRQQLHRPECASQPAALCESLLPSSEVVRKLKGSLAQDLANQEERRRLYDEAGRSWARAEEVRDDQQAAAALMSAAELEVRLGQPERAAEALEALLAKYPTVASLPAAIVQLARIYREQMGMPEKSQALLDRLAKEHPEYAAGERTGS